MTDELDPRLRALFAKAQEPLSDGDFLARVVERVGRRQRRTFLERTVLIVAGVVLLAFAAPSILRVTADTLSLVAGRDSDYSSLLVTPAGWTLSLLVGAFVLYRSLRTR